MIYNACVQKWRKDRKELKKLATTIKGKVSSYTPEVQSIGNVNNVINVIEQKSNEYRGIQDKKLRLLMYTLDKLSETKSELANYANAIVYYVARERKQTEGKMKEALEEYLKAEMMDAGETDQRQQTSERGKRFRKDFLKKISKQFDEGNNWAILWK